MKKIAEFLEAVFGKLGLCSLVGAVIGGVVGFLFGLLQGAMEGLSLGSNELLQISLILSIPAWLFVLLLFGIWLKYGVRNIALQAIVNALITSTVTIFILDQLAAPELGTIIGILVGALVGSILCWWCQNRILGVRKQDG